MRIAALNVVPKHPVRLTLMSLGLLSGSFSAEAQDYNPGIPQVSEDSGDQPNRALDNAVGEETIDPFTGALKIVVTDLVIPGNGGLALKVVRNYQSFAQVQGVQVPV